MPSTVPAALQAHYERGAQTTSRLAKIGPLRDGVTYIRLTSRTTSERYDCGDGLGEQTYFAASGLELSTFQSSSDLSVDNAEARSLIPKFPAQGITIDQVQRGELDGARYVVFEHDHVGGAAGEHRIVSGGVLGECRIVQGLLVIPELRSWLQLFDQNGLIPKTCLDCRVRHFGSQPGEEEEWCGYVITYEWVPFTVSAVGDESIREFYSDDLPEALFPPSAEGEGYFAPGSVRWTGGNNANSEQEVESFTAGDSNGAGYVSLRFTTRKAIQIGDAGEIRRDCTRKFSGHNSCQTYHGAQRGRRFRGECYINIGDTVANTVPGVNAISGTGGTGEEAAL